MQSVLLAIYYKKKTMKNNYLESVKSLNLSMLILCGPVVHSECLRCLTEEKRMLTI